MQSLARRSAAFRLSLALLVVGLSSGCRGMQIHQLERRIDQLESRVSSLEGRLSATPQR